MEKVSTTNECKNDLSIVSPKKDVLESKTEDTRKRRSNDELDLEEDGNFRGFVGFSCQLDKGHYMQVKNIKLMHQIHDNVQLKSDLFKGLSFHVNGHTNPPGIELRQLITENGGEWHTYFNAGCTTYKIAEALAASKWRSITKVEIFLKPAWIVDSLNQHCLLPIEGYKLRPGDTTNREEQQEQTSVVESFFQRSRLHLISTLAQELKKFVDEMRNDGRSKHEFTSRERLKRMMLEEGGTGDKSTTSLEIPVICHIDMDCFFVSVGLRSRPELKGKPVVVTSAKTTSAKSRADIASCSYEARSFNIQNGMWLNDAVAKCPDLVCIPYEFEHYRETSRQLYSILARYTLDIKAISCDEVYIDLTELCNDIGINDPLRVVEEIRREIFEETGCSASAGLGYSELVARLATRKAKPNGQFYLRREDVNSFVKEIPLKTIPGIGYSLMKRLRSNFGEELTICKDLYGIPLSKFKELLGDKQGKKIYNAIRGISTPGLQIKDNVVRKSVSCDVNFGVRLKTQTDLSNFIRDLSKQISRKLQDDVLVGSSLGIKVLIRCPDAADVKFGAHGACNVYTKSNQLPSKTNDVNVIQQVALKMIFSMNPTITDVRGIGLQMTNIARSSDVTSGNSILKHLKPVTLNDQNPPGIQLVKSMRTRRKKKNNLPDGQRYVKRRDIAKLPELLFICTCSGSHHKLSIDLTEAPSPESVQLVKCFFKYLVFQDRCIDAKRMYLKVRKELGSITVASLIQDGSTPSSSSFIEKATEKKEEWRRQMEEIRSEINKEAQKRFGMLVIPKGDLSE